MTSLTRLMAVDHGMARIGIALSDPLLIVARPYTIVQHSNQTQDFSAIRQIAIENGVIKIIVGLPTSSRGGLSNQARTVILWSRKLAKSTARPIVMWDESYSSERAAEIIRANRKKSSGHHDDVAAASFLQDYLDALRGQEHEPGQALETFAEVK